MGYESISVVGIDFFPTQAPNQGSWWSSLLRKSTPTCDPHQIFQGDTFRTNISAFNYQVDSVYVWNYDPSSNSTLPSGLIAGFAYAADPLASACDDYDQTTSDNGRGGSRTLKLSVDSMQKTVTGSVSFRIF